MSVPRTLNDIFFGSIEQYRDRPVAMRHKVAGRWTDISYKDVLARVRGLSLGLRELGVHPGDRVAILSENRPEWAFADFACLAARCADVPIYPTLPAAADRVHPQGLRRGGDLRLEPGRSSQKITEIRGHLPGLRHVIAFDTDAGRATGVLSVDEVIRRGRGGSVALSPTGRAMRQQVEAGRPRDAHLHLGHHRRPQGRDAHARQHLLERAWRRSRVLPLRGTDECLSASCRCRTSSSGWPATTACSHAGHDHRLRRVSIDTVPREHGRRSARRSCSRCRGCTRRCTRGCWRTRWPAAALKKQIFFWAQAASRERWAEYAAGGQAGRRAASRSSTRSPTGWCSPSSRRGPAAGSGSSSPAARRSRRRSPSSSSRPGCRSSRATASPRRRPVIAVNTPAQLTHRHGRAGRSPASRCRSRRTARSSPAART